MPVIGDIIGLYIFISIGEIQISLIKSSADNFEKYDQIFYIVIHSIFFDYVYF